MVHSDVKSFDYREVSYGRVWFLDRNITRQFHITGYGFDVGFPGSFDTLEYEIVSSISSAVDSNNVATITYM